MEGDGECARVVREECATSHSAASGAVDLAAARRSHVEATSAVGGAGEALREASSVIAAMDAESYTLSAAAVSDSDYDSTAARYCS